MWTGLTRRPCFSSSFSLTLTVSGGGKKKDITEVSWCWIHWCKGQWKKRVSASEMHKWQRWPLEKRISNCCDVTRTKFFWERNSKDYDCSERKNKEMSKTWRWGKNNEIETARSSERKKSHTTCTRGPAGEARGQRKEIEESTKSVHELEREPVERAHSYPSQGSRITRILSSEEEGLRNDGIVRSWDCFVKTKLNR